jgi:radical SAM superfamily enzyme YgiQ (UPF0313 family)
MNRETLDMLFVHPPANTGDSSPTLDADVDYTSQFVSFPMGIFSMSDNIEKDGKKVKILNLGERAYNNKGKSLDSLVKEFLQDYNPELIGIDAHWMIHSNGAIETAKLVKKYSPDTKIVLGGFTASLFAEEILQKYRDIDFVMRGECDDAIVPFINEFQKQTSDLSSVPNLAYRLHGQIIQNEIVVPDMSDSLEITRYDLLIDDPTVNPDRALITMFRGCKNHCCYCTGAKESFNDVMGRNSPAMLSAEKIVELIERNKEKGRDKIYLYGDIRHGGEDYINKFFTALENSKVKDAHLVFEFFSPITEKNEDYLQRWKAWADKNNCSLEATYSPESGNQEVRKQFGKGYPNETIIKHCELVTKYGIPQSTYFMLGLPGQTKEEVEETLNLADKIVGIYVKRFQKEDLRHAILAYTFMQIPDAGSRLFQNPERFGFHFDFNGFEGLIDILSKAKHWSEAVGYSTDNFTKQEIVRTYFHIQEKVLGIYKKHELVTDKIFDTKMDAINQDKEKYMSLQRGWEK